MCVARLLSSEPFRRGRQGANATNATRTAEGVASRPLAHTAPLGSPVGLWGVPKCPVVFGCVRCSRPRTDALGFSDGVRQRIVCHFPATRVIRISH